MKAVGLTRFLPIDDPQSLRDFDIPQPKAEGRDLLVRVKAVSLNPVDTKVRSTVKDELAQPKILGYDAAGIVEAIGGDVTLFKPGDEVFYAGDVTRSGTNAEMHLVDERIVGAKPKSLDFAGAAALPLTSLTAYELMFERMRIDFDGADRGKSLLILSGAGGVGSMAIQLANSPVSSSSRLLHARKHRAGASRSVPTMSSIIASRSKTNCPESDSVPSISSSILSTPTATGK